MAATKGNCYLCGAELGKTAMKNHILKEHNGPGDGQECCLLKIEGAYDKDYWLYVDIPVNRTLSVLDTFLRKIWLECCGHMSGFQGAGKSTKLGDLEPGYQFLHEYDYGDTTETLITVVGRIYRPAQKGIVRLLARNVPPVFACAECGAPADFICTECQYDSGNPFYCEKCGAGHEHEDMLLPVTNSPRMGVCGYEGELDTFAYVPPKKVQKVEPAVRQKPPANPKAGFKQAYPDELYDLAFALRKAKLWSKMYEDEMFAIPLPDGETGYISVMGIRGEHLALALYPGQGGLQSFCSIQSMGESGMLAAPPNMLKFQEAMLTQNCLQCSFGNKEDLSEEELSSARAYAAPRKMRFSGANAFPQFMKFAPARMPIPITEEEDIQVLMQAIKAALAVKEKTEEAGWHYEARESLGFSKGTASGQTYPLLTPEGEGFAWSIQRFGPQPAPGYPQPALQDELLRERLKRAKKQKNSWACDLVMVPDPVEEEEGEVPYFPYILLLVDMQSGMSFPSVVVRDYEQDAEALLHDLGEKMLTLGPPRKILAADDRTYSFLSAFASAAQIELVEDAGNELLEDVEEELFDVMASDELDEPGAGGLPEMIEELLAEGDEEMLLSIPEPVWESLRSIIEGENVPEGLRARFYEVDRKRRL